MTFGGRAAAALITLSLTVPVRAQPSAPGEWSITYSISGGIAGLSRHVTVTSGGRLQLDDRKVGRLDVPAPADLSIRMRDLVDTPREIARGQTGPVDPDAMSTTLTLTSEGRTREVEPTPEVVNALTRAADAAVWQTLVGTWRQSGWTLCTPAAPLAPGDADPVIEALTLAADGTFSVRWPGG